MDIQRPNLAPRSESFRRPTPFRQEELQLVSARSLIRKNIQTILPPPKRHPMYRLLSIGLGTILFMGALLWFGNSWKNKLLYEGEAGYGAIEQAADALRQHDIILARNSLSVAQEHFDRGHRWLLGTQFLLPLLRSLPGLDEVTSGIALMQAGGHLVRGAQSLTSFLEKGTNILQTTESPSLLHLIEEAEPFFQSGGNEFTQAEKYFQMVRLESIPVDRREAFARGMTWLPLVTQALTFSSEHVGVLRELLGGNGPRTYLFLFQNNHELRPTGGFIGSYARLDINQGQIRQFFVDGIFNPDGQLKENIVPPGPIQKISAGWSLHDSNWFPDFPTSAEKAMFFYEKTGGPTTDGVIALTPVVLERLLRVLGPIDLPDYGITVDADTFMPLIQEEVETKYNKEENSPKRILGDLTGVMLNRILVAPKGEMLFQLADTMVSLCNEKHILVYARNQSVEDLIGHSGWSGEMLSTPYDYASVIHTNVNGYKTDGVIQESIQHVASIQDDGSVIDTITITRKHNGGNTPYEWWNKVNADYMRVYVPLGSELLSAEGMTPEFPPAPLDYDALGFRRDAEVEHEEASIKIDESSGTRVGEEFGKTVFGNWVYVSPGESVTVTYRYRLPFKLPITVLTDQPPIPFSVLFQKQAGTQGIQLRSKIEFPTHWQPIWQSPENLVTYGRDLSLETVFDTNLFLGVVFNTKK